MWGKPVGSWKGRRMNGLGGAEKVAVCAKDAMHNVRDGRSSMERPNSLTQRDFLALNRRATMVSSPDAHQLRFAPRGSEVVLHCSRYLLEACI